MVDTFLFDRVIAVTRPTGQTGVGAQGYSGVQQGTETPVVSNIPACIQSRATSSRLGRELFPAAAPGPIVWRVFIPENMVADDVIKDRDIITDDLGRRFQVEAAYPTQMGWNIAAVILEAR